MFLRSNYTVYCYETLLWIGHFSLLLKSCNWMQRAAVQKKKNQHILKPTLYCVTFYSKKYMSVRVSIGFQQLKSSVAASFLNEDILWELLKNMLVFQFSKTDFLYSYVPNSIRLKLWDHKNKYMYKTHESFSCQKLIISTLIHQVLTGFERSSCSEQLGSWRSALCSDKKLRFLSLQGYEISDFK